MIEFKGKTILITGGGAGIGRATAEAFGRAGARLAVAEIDPARAMAVRQALETTDVEALVLECDVTRPDHVASLADRIGAQFGGLDVLVNNVGDFRMLAKPFESYSDEEIEQLYAVNLKHIFMVTRAMLPLLRRNAPGSSIISVSSIEGFRAIPNCSVYATFKSAITGFTKKVSRSSWRLAASG
ncbi:SDR family NAD(P)-dependent oxidoreductase [Undibacterium arcticum]